MDRASIVSLVYDCPVDIAKKLGYDRLTDLHDDWIRRMVFGDDDETLQGHRGSFKTTCLIIAFAFILVLFPSKRVIFLRKTDPDVAEVMNGVARALDHSYFKALSRMLYGFEVEVVKATQSEVHTNLACGVSGASQLVGIGCGGSLTGKHADFVFTDDIVNIKDRVSAAERERIKLIYQELQNIKNPGGRIFNTGTPWHKNDAFSIMPTPIRFDCYSTGLMTRADVQKKRENMTPSLFAANYELKHIADKNAMFGEAKFFSDFKLLYNGVMHVDASYGGEDGTAATAIRKDGDVYYVCGRRWDKPVDECLDDIRAMHSALRLGTLYCESNSDKGYLAKDIAKLGIPVSTYSESMNKYIKISTHGKGAWKKTRFLDCDDYRLDCGYLNEILDYTENAAHDDAPDSFASAVRQVNTGIHLNKVKGGL